MLKVVGAIKPDQAIESPILCNYHDRAAFEEKFAQLLSDSEMILGTSTRAIDIIALSFLEYWKYEPVLVLLKFIDALTKGMFKRIPKNVIDLPTLNGFFIEFKGPYIEALELSNRARDKDCKTLNIVDYEKYKKTIKNEKSEEYKRAKRLSDYFSRWYKKNILQDSGNIRSISDKPGKDQGNDKKT